MQQFSISETWIATAVGKHVRARPGVAPPQSDPPAWAAPDRRAAVTQLGAQARRRSDGKRHMEHDRARLRARPHASPVRPSQCPHRQFARPRSRKRKDGYPWSSQTLTPLYGTCSFVRCNYCGIPNMSTWKGGRSRTPVTNSKSESLSSIAQPTHIAQSNLGRL